MGFIICVSVIFAASGLLLTSSANNMSNSENQTETMPYRFMSVDHFFRELRGDMSSVNWAHRVNSYHLLWNAIRDWDKHMIEADIIMGKDCRSTTDERLPIMAHPPSTVSDLTFQQFLTHVFQANKVRRRRVGIKLDFKEIEAVEPSLIILAEKVQEEGLPIIPIFINADILPGPINATKTPLPAREFILLVQRYAPFATLSVGWTTRYGHDDSYATEARPPIITSHGIERETNTRNREVLREGKYVMSHIDAMIDILREFESEPTFQHVTFPVRAGLAVESIDELLDLMARVRLRNSLTIWSAPDDTINEQNFESLQAQVGERKCFLDLTYVPTERLPVYTPRPLPEVHPYEVINPRAPVELQDGVSDSGSSYVIPSICVIGLAIGIAIYVTRKSS